VAKSPLETVPPAPRPPPASTVEPLVLPQGVRQLRTALGAILVTCLLGMVVATYFRIEQELQATLRAQLSAVLEANVRSARTWLDEQTELARRLAAETTVARAAARVVQADGAETEARAAEFERVTYPYRIAARVGEIRVLEPGGRPRTGTGPFPTLGPALLSRLRERGTLSLFPDMGQSKTGQLATLALVGDRRAPEAILALVVDPGRLPHKLRAATWGKSGETFAFSANGTFVTAPRFELPKSTPGAGAPLGKMAKSARLHHRGVDVDGYPSYRGTRVVGAWQWLDGYDLGIATQVTHREAHESVLVLRIAFVVLSALVGATLLGFLGLARWSLRVRQDAVLVNERLGRLGRTISALSAALENDPSAVLLVDETGTVVYANASSHRVLRVHLPLVGHPVSRALGSLPPELQAALDSGSDSIASGGTKGEDETLLVSSRDLRIHGQPHVLFMLRPITQQVRRQELDHWRNLLRVLSHELNNSLAPITSLLSSARKVNSMGAKDAQLEKIFDAIVERTGRLLAFLESYRTIARLPMPAARDVDFAAFVDGLAYQAPFRVAGPPPTTKGYFDPVQMERVLLNLIKNSEEAGSPTKDIELSIREEIDSVRIDVLDRGSGMSEPVLKQAMLPFFSTKEGGTGVGLALAREVVEAHGGRMVLANREGGGLIVSMYLPNAPPPASQSKGSLSRLRIMEKPGVEKSSQDPTSER